MNLDTVGSRSSYILYTEHELVYDFVYRKLTQEAGAKRQDVIEADTDRQARELFTYQGVQPLDARKWVYIINTARVSSALLTPLIKMAETDDGGLYLFNTNHGRDFFRVRGLSSPLTSPMFVRSYSFADMKAVTADMGMSPVVVEALAKGYRNDLSSPFELQSKIVEGYSVTSQKDVTELLGVSATMTSRTVFEMLYTIKDKKRRLKRVIPSLIAAEEKVGAFNYRKTLANSAKEYFDLRMLMQMGIVYKTIPKELPSGFYYKRLIKHRFLLESGKLEDIPLVRSQRMWLELSSEKDWYTQADMLEWVYSWFS